MEIAIWSAVQAGRRKRAGLRDFFWHAEVVLVRRRHQGGSCDASRWRRAGLALGAPRLPAGGMIAVAAWIQWRNRAVIVTTNNMTRRRIGQLQLIMIDAAGQERTPAGSAQCHPVLCPAIHKSLLRRVRARSAHRGAACPRFRIRLVPVPQRSHGVFANAVSAISNSMIALADHQVSRHPAWIAMDDAPGLKRTAILHHSNDQAERLVNRVRT